MSAARLIPLSDIPNTAARNAERAARKRHPTRAAALEAARFEIVDAEGTYSGAFQPSRGWVVSRRAADAIAAEIVRMPGGTQHRKYAVKETQ